MLQLAQISILFSQLTAASTETALLYTVNNICQSADEGNGTLLVSLDFSAAFDTVDHNLLISRHDNSIGIRGNFSSWIDSYITDRSPIHPHWPFLLQQRILHLWSASSLRSWANPVLSPIALSLNHTTPANNNMQTIHTVLYCS